MIVQHGIISTVEDDGTVKITVPERDDYITPPLTIPPHLKYKLGKPAVGENIPDGSFYVEEFELTPGMAVAFVEFTDMTGVVLAVLEAQEG